MAYVERTVRDGKVRYKARYVGTNGKEYSRTFDKKGDADDHLAAQRVSRKRGDWVDPNLGKVPVGKWAERWFATTAHLKPTTRAGYRSLLDTCILPTFRDTQLRHIQNIDVKEWVSGMTARGLSASRTRQGFFTFGAIMKAAVENGYIGKNPCTGVKLPRPSGTEMRFLDAGQVSRLAGEVDDRYRALILVLCYGGLRCGEAAALRRGRCDLLRSRLQIRESVSEVNGHLHFGSTKTHRVRWVRLPARLRDALAEHLAHYVDDDPDALVFTSSAGDAIRLPNFRRRVWLPALEAAGLPAIRIHDMRHTCAALLISKGAPGKMIQAHLGHKHITTTLGTYGHLFPDDMDRLADALDETYRDAMANETPPHGPPEVVAIAGRSRKRASDQGK